MIVNVLTDDGTTVEIIQSSLPNVVEVYQTTAPEVVEIVTAGPQGPVGPVGPVGPIANTGSFATTSSLNALTSSFNAFTSSYNTGSFSGSFIGSLSGTASWATNALTASYLSGYVSPFPYTGSARITGSLGITGSLDITEGITGSLFGTASFAVSSSYALSASYSNNSTSASYSISSSQSQNTISSSYSLSSSYAVSSSYSVSSSRAVSSSYAENAATASSILGGKAPHIPFFITDTTLATSSLYQSGSTSVIINQDNNTTANPEALYVWQPHPTSFNVISGKGDINNYLQLNIQNTNQGANASSDVVATANNGNESTNYIDMGINSQNYNANFIGNANDAYLYSTGNDLHIGNASDKPVQIFAGGSDVDVHNKLILNPNNQHSMSGSLDVSGSVKAFSFTGSLQGNASTATTAGNGGVTQLLAGPNITLGPTNGLGQVTISSTGGGGGGFNTATGSYGSFYNTVTQTNVASTARSMSLNITDISNGVSISGSTDPFNTYIKTENAGVYDIQFSAQVDKTDSGTDEIWIWLRKNGTDLTDTATSLQLVGNGAHYVAAWNFFVNAAANDYFQLMWYSPDANVRLHAESAFGVVPGIPSLIVTVNRVDQFLSNTGSFSGTFTGDLIGTASYATTSSYTQNAQSASYALTASYALNGGGGGSGNGFPFTGTAQITGSLIVTTNVQIDQSLIDYSSVNSSIVGNNNLYQIATGSYTSAFTKYTVSNGANTRAGEFVTVWNGTTVVNYDNSTTDIGNTSDVVFVSSIVTSQIKIDAFTATSAWKIKSTTTFI